MAVIETWLHQDLQEPVKVNHLDGNLFSNNGNGNRIGVVLTNNGEALASISGTVSGYVVTADGSTVPCTGSKSGNRASILIPAAAYQPGSIFITVFVTDGTTVTTIGAVSTTVMRSRTNAQVDPGSAVTDWTQTINAAMQSVKTAAANLGGIVAVPYASITFPVPLGKYTYYSNNLYRCITPIASSESFTAAHWTQVRLGDEVSDLKSALRGADGAEIGRLFIPCNDNEVTKTDYSYKKIGNCMLMNGYSATASQRFCIYGDFAYVGKTPTYANVPEWYHAPCDKIIIGHTYYFDYKLVSGTLNKNGSTDNIYYRLAKSDNTLVDVVVGNTWEATFVPEMMAFVLHDYIYTDAVIELIIYDLTEMYANPAFVDLATLKDRCVRVDVSQSLTSAQKATGRNNIDAASMQDLDTVSKESGAAAIGKLYFECTDSTLAGTGYSYQKINNVLLFNGERSAERQRFCIYGQFDYLGHSPTYADYPTWYHEPCAKFVIGHKYYMSWKVISGTVVPGHSPESVYFYYDLRTSSGDQISIRDGIWTCTFVPEMIAFCGLQFYYTNAVIEMLVYDVTEVEENQLVSNVIQKYIDSENAYIIPSYFNSQLNTAISKIITDINAGKTQNYGTDIEAFVFLTDVHWANNKQHSPALVRKILNETPVKTVICGGDIIYSHNETKKGALEEIHGFTNAIVGCPCYDYYAVYGNHDDNSNGNSDLSIMLTKDEQYNAMYAPFSDKPNVHWIWQDFPEAYNEAAMKNDYYFDHARTRTRYICMDWNNPFNTVRITWLQSVLGKNDGYRVIIIYHGIYTKTVDGQGNITFNPEHIQFMSYLEPYKNKIVALVTGHAHADGVVDYFGDGSVPVILTDCDTYKTGEGTVDEQCFDVMVVDYLNSKIKITRIGRGSDREVNISLS